MDKKNPLISVVVPVCNVEPYLDKCLDSIERQTWKELEIIIVDDASSDGSGRICDIHAGRDERIEAVHFPVNRGLAAARNEGVSRARGEYLAFVDSDDYVEPWFLERLWLSMRRSGAELGICGVDGFPAGEVPGTVLSPGEIVRCMVRRSPFLWNAWGKLYPTEVVKQYPFDGRALCCEDLVFFYQVLGRTKRAGYVPDKLYHYVYREKSIINNGVDERRCTVLSALDAICRDASARCPKLWPGLEQIALDTGARLAMQAVEGGVPKGELIRYLKRFCGHTRRHFHPQALRLCPCKKSLAAQGLLCVGWAAFLGFALAYKAVKKVQKGVWG